MVDNLAEMVDECLTLSIVCIHTGPQKVSVIRSSGVSAIQGLFIIASFPGHRENLYSGLGTRLYLLHTLACLLSIVC